MCERVSVRQSGAYAWCVVCAASGVFACLSPATLLVTQSDSLCLHPRGVDTADYTYSTVPRRCGGSHTLTYPYRRNRPQHLSPLEEIQIAMKV